MRGKARLERADRGQVRLEAVDLEALVGAEHRVRAVWRFVEGLDLSPLHEEIRSREGGAGRPAIDPAILVCLWLYATLENVGSARELERLTRAHLAYRWICGGVSVNHHSLSDFRVGQAAFLDELLTRSVAALVTAGVTRLEEVAQDGLRTRAAAGGGSFRRRATLEAKLAQARERVERLKAEVTSDPAASTKRRAAAEARAAREAERQAQAALEALAEIEARRERARKKHGKRVKGQGEPRASISARASSAACAWRSASRAARASAAARRLVLAAGSLVTSALRRSGEPRASTTDPDARVMKMADGGFRPAYNLQISMDTQCGAVVGVQVSNDSSDKGLVQPMVEDVRRRFGGLPRRWLVDTGFASNQTATLLAEASEDGVEAYMPIPPAFNGQPARTPPKDMAAAWAWHERMGRDDGKAVYKRRCQIEWVNAGMRNRGLVRLPVRGAAKVKAVLLWQALAHNLLCLLRNGIGVLPAAA